MIRKAGFWFFGLWFVWLLLHDHPAFIHMLENFMWGLELWIMAFENL